MLIKVFKRTGWLLACLLLCQSSAVLAQGSVKIAVVDLERVVLLSKAGQELQTKLETFQKEVQAKGEQMTSEAEDIRKRVAEGSQSLADEKLAELQKQLEDKAIEIRRFRDDKQREGEKMRNEGLRKIEIQLEPVFKAIRDENGYDLILNNVPGVVVMANDNVDITAKVVERLNAGQGGGG